MPSWKEFALAGGVESCCIALFFSSVHFRVLFPLVIIPGIFLEFLLGGNVHDDSFQWIGILASGLFWTCTLALAYHKIRKITRTE